MYTVALVITEKNQKQPSHPSIDEWLNKSWYNYFMKYYSTNKRHNTWNSPDGSHEHFAKKSQYQKFEYCMIPFI